MTTTTTRYFFNGKDITGQSFTDGSEIYHHSNWLESATPEELEAAGVSQVEEPIPEPVQPSPLEELMQAAETVREALKLAVQERYELVQAAIGADFKNSAEFKTFAAYPNAFQVSAIEFGRWEAEVWFQANQYKALVLAGQADMLSPQEAIEMMPEYPLPEVV